MYTAHFGFREKPFALSPDPRYLFLSASHREVLAHLVYGIEQGEGFMAISGEVGTGRPRCAGRCSSGSARCEIAFLFNRLSPGRADRAINSELGARPWASAPSCSTSSTPSCSTRREGRRVLVIIDEAQNLPVETLEQLRLLSNLETPPRS